VREDYSADGDAWASFPHDHARSRAYRWNEDGLAGWSDDRGLLCFALALWNGRDPILKERLFGLSNAEGNHGEDVKEVYFYVDATPTHSYQSMLYRYPQAEFPYARLVEESARRSREEPEPEIAETGVFEGSRWFDVLVEYAKASPEDVLVRITATNRGPEEAVLHLLPTLWFRNDWDWEPGRTRPEVAAVAADAVRAHHPELGHHLFSCDRVRDASGRAAPGSDPQLLFTENETNHERLFATANRTPFVKDAFHRFVVDGERGAVNPAARGTKSAAWYRASIPAGERRSIRLRLRAGRADERGAGGMTAGPATNGTFADFDETFALRRREADLFHESLLPEGTRPELRLVQRRALAGLLWNKQFYHYDVRRWLRGDPGQPTPPRARLRGRNHEWTHLNNCDVLSMPDKWEYPWYASWDLAFHCVPLALVDPDFAKHQLELMLREWYQHPNGQVPAYEWAFGDVNPPVLAWAAWRVYRTEEAVRGRKDRAFLERAFHKLILNFTWWVNRKDSEGNNVFQGGFLGLDNIGVFDRSKPLPTGGTLEQSDGTSWMGMFSLDLLTIALELARENPVYQDIATKFFEHFLYIAEAMNNLGGEGVPLWNDEDEFFYDVLHLPDGRVLPMRLRSFVGLIPLFAVRTLEPDLLEQFPDFRERLEWFLENRPELARLVSRWHEPGFGKRHLLALVRGSRMKRLLRRALDPNEFLSPHGVRSMSRAHAEHPYVLGLDGGEWCMRYEPGESRSAAFGGNSNWRGPVWLPVNFLLVEALRKLHAYYGDDFLVECPTGSGSRTTLDGIADFLSRRLVSLFLPGEDGRRPCDGASGEPRIAGDEDLLVFHDFFHGDDGRGLGARQQTGWTGLVAELVREIALREAGGGEVED
ncbi:MAG: MGH1-like glycoside hydrolase domain-containing protein, partial [Alphaproteobacteria bacterium]